MKLTPILLVDAGATKTAFTVLLGHQVACQHIGAGINPNYNTENEIVSVFEGFAKACATTKEMSEVFFYGSGCANPKNDALIGGIIQSYMPDAAIHIYSDLMAVCHALSKNKRSVVVILGTGSASCLFDGTHIVNCAPSLGYLLGDEGSGTNLGKRLMTDYLNGKLPAHLSAELEKEFHFTFDDLIYQIYKASEPNKIMSSLAPFVNAHLHDEYIYRLAFNAFSEFFALQKVHYPDSNQLEWNLSGSVAFHFQKVVREAAAAQDCPIGKIVAAPMDDLIRSFME